MNILGMFQYLSQLQMKTNILFINTPFKIFRHLFSTQITHQLLPPIKLQKYIKGHQINLNDKQAESILQAMSSSSLNKSVVISRMINYLDLSTKRTPQGLLSIVWALNECEDTQVVSYCRHFLEHILRTEDMSVYKCNKLELNAILKQLSIKRSQSYQKIKQSLIKYKTAQLIMGNQKIICSIHFRQIISLLTSNDRMTVTTNSRFLSLAQVLNQKIFDFLQLYLENKLNGEQKFVTPNFVNSTMYYFRQYPPQHADHSKLLMAFLAQAVFEKNKQFKKLILYNIHRCFPYWTKTRNGQYYKDIILKKIVQRQKKRIDVGQDWNQGLICYSILSFQFYKAIEQTQFRYEKQLNYLLRQDIQIPQLPSIFWQKYKKSPQIVNKDHIARNIIKKVYPNKYIRTPQVQSSTIKPPKVTQNEIKVRMDLALESLNLKSMKEVEVSGRYVDFLIDDVIIECDGDHHFDLHRMDYNQSTQFRNMHLLLAGYRLLIINIFEYNQYRKTQALASLISKKLAILNKHNAAIIL